jgi:hypothetical protein
MTDSSATLLVPLLLASRRGRSASSSCSAPCTASSLSICHRSTSLVAAPAAFLARPRLGAARGAGRRGARRRVGGTGFTLGASEGLVRAAAGVESPLAGARTLAGLGGILLGVTGGLLVGGGRLGVRQVQQVHVLLGGVLVPQHRVRAALIEHLRHRGRQVRRVLGQHVQQLDDVLELQRLPAPARRGRGVAWRGGD